MDRTIVILFGSSLRRARFFRARFFRDDLFCYGDDGEARNQGGWRRYSVDRGRNGIGDVLAAFSLDLGVRGNSRDLLLQVKDGGLVKRDECKVRWA